MPYNIEWSDQIISSLKNRDLPVIQEAVVVTSGSSTVRADFVIPSVEGQPPLVFEFGSRDFTSDKALQVMGMESIVDGQVSIVVPEDVNMEQQLEDAMAKRNVHIIKGDVNDITEQIFNLHNKGSID